MRKSLLAAGLLLFATTPLLAEKRPKNHIIDTPYALETWCEDQVIAHFRRKKRTVYNWSARTVRELNDLHTSAAFLAVRVHMQASCRIKIGRKAESTQISILKEN